MPSCPVLWQESTSMKIFLRETQASGIWLFVFFLEYFCIPLHESHLTLKYHFTH